MIKNIKTIVSVASFIIIGVLIFFACQKEEVITKNSVIEPVSLKSETTHVNGIEMEE